MGDHCWIVAGMTAEQKQLIRASQIAARKTPSAPESPLSLCYVTDRERRGEWDCACAEKLNTCCFVPCGKVTSTCVLIAVMADWNRSNHFDTPCISVLRRVQTGPGVHPGCDSIRTVFVFLRVKRSELEVTHPPHLALRLWISGATYLLPLYTFLVWRKQSHPLYIIQDIVSLTL